MSSTKIAEVIENPNLETEILEVEDGLAVTRKIDKSYIIWYNIFVVKTNILLF